MSGSKKVEAGHYLFREGDPPDAMYVVKSGKFAVVKSKSSAEIVLAEIGPGAMVGEMAFFDNKPRSASVKALKESEVIALPYKALHAQFANFPEWCKAIMRTVNDHLRNTNQRLKQLEKSSNDDEELFPPHIITKLTAILGLVSLRYGKQEADGLHVNGNTIRNYTIQIFQEPTHRMQKLQQTLQEKGILKMVDLGEGKSKIIMEKVEFVMDFVDWYNDWLFKQEKDRILVTEGELRVLTAVHHFGKKNPPDAKGLAWVNLSMVQNESMKELGTLVKVEEALSLVEKKLFSEQMTKGEGIFTSYDAAMVDKIVPFWDLVYTLKKVTRN